MIFMKNARVEKQQQNYTVTVAQNPEHPERYDTAIYKINDDTKEVCKK